MFGLRRRHSRVHGSSCRHHYHYRVLEVSRDGAVFPHTIAVLRSGGTRLDVIADPSKWMWVLEKFQKQHRMLLAVKYKFHRPCTIAIERLGYVFGPFPAKQIPLTEYKSCQPNTLFPSLSARHVSTRHDKTCFKIVESFIVVILRSYE